MTERSGDAVALLGMEGFDVLSTIGEDGELFVLVETSPPRLGCPSCGVVAVGHGRSTVQIRDLPSGGRPVRLSVEEAAGTLPGSGLCDELVHRGEHARRRLPDNACSQRDLSNGR